MKRLNTKHVLLGVIALLLVALSVSYAMANQGAAQFQYAVQQTDPAQQPDQTQQPGQIQQQPSPTPQPYPAPQGYYPIPALMAPGTDLLTPTTSQTMTGTTTAATMAATDGAPGEWAGAGKILDCTPVRLRY